MRKVNRVYGPIEAAVDRIKTAQLIPPIKAMICLNRPDGTEYLEITVWASQEKSLEDAIKAAASPVSVDVMWVVDHH